MITPEKKTIEEILKQSSVKYEVPKYQRNFDWGKSELLELMDDLKEITASNNKELFLGNIIFDISNKEKYKIVDGQQRLTTIVLILIALREQAKKLNEHEFSSELQNLITTGSSWAKEKGSKLQVSENIRPLFDYISQNDWDGKFPDRLNDKSIKRPVNKVGPIYKYVLDGVLKYNIEDLICFTRSLMNSYVIVIKVENTDDVFSIFERTNARGLDLNIGDLLKNYIFSHGIGKFEEKWKDIISNSQNSLQRMLKYFWISRRGPTLMSNLYKNLKSYGVETEIEVFVNELYMFSRYYKVVLSLDPIDVKDWLEEMGLEDLSKNEYYYKRISRVFQSLKLFRITQAYPLIYAIFTYFKKGENLKYSKKLFLILEAIEKYHFVNNVISTSIGNEVEKFYANKAEQFYSLEENFEQNIDKLILELKDKKASKEEFVPNFIDTIIYENKNIPLINYVFDRINNYGARGGQIIEIYSPEKDLNKRNFDIEHIIPQSNKQNFNNDDEKEIIDRIGNLLIIPRHTNSILQNKNSNEKFKIIQSDLKHIGNLRYINSFLDEYKEDLDCWNIDVINKRSKKIAEDAFDLIWNF